MKQIKSLMLLLSLAFWGTAAFAQKIHTVEPVFSDYLTVLKEAGFEVFSYDISSLKDTTYNIHFITKEYVNGKVVENGAADRMSMTLANRIMISDFREDDQKSIMKEGNAVDIEKGIYRLAGKISIGFISATDSLKKIRMSVENIGSIGGALKLKPINAPGYEKRYSYSIRPFKLDKINIGDFTPLLLVGSFWYDEQRGIIRFCGESEFSPDLSSSTLSLVPHYYVIGIWVDKNDKKK